MKASFDLVVPAGRPDRAANAGEAVSGCVERSRTAETASATSAMSATDAA